MGERLTAEREAAYRKAAARLDVREVHTAEVEAERFAAMTLLLVGVNDLLAELDAVRAERDEAFARADRAEAGLAALHAALARWRDTPRRPECDLGTCGACSVCLLAELRRALADTAAAAEAHTRRVEAKVLEAAGEAYECDEDHDDTGGVCPKRWLAARAAEIRGGR